MLYSINDTLNKHKPKDLPDTKLKLCENILGVCIDSKEDVIKRINNEINITIPYLTIYMAIIFKHFYYPSGAPRKKYFIKDYDQMNEMEQLFASNGVSFGDNQLIELEEAAPEDKRNGFDKYFREDRNYMDYDNWFENVCEQLVLFKETIMSLKPNELLLVGEW
jgi:hypothetical protein